MLRYNTSVKVGHRLIWEGRILEIGALTDPDSDKRWYEALCREVRGRGIDE
jgi:SPP1 family predicted phage head-tail adaptor